MAKITDHFDGTSFTNLPGVPPRPTFGEILKWRFSKRSGPTWTGFADIPPGPRPPERVSNLRATFVGHATVLVQQNNVNILTDPVWSSRVGPASWIGAKRYRSPGIRFEDLPPIDAVLISHDHYDHLDLPTLRRLAATFPEMTIVTGLGNGAFLGSNEVQAPVIELDWWQSASIAGVEVVAVPAAHWSRRQLIFANRTLWAGFAIRSTSGVTFFAGDTGWGSHFADIRDRLSPIRLALLPIGAYKPEWFMGPQHLGPKDALEAARVLQASMSIGIHFGTFDLADDGQHQAAEELVCLRDCCADRVRFEVLQEGDGVDVPDVA